MQECSSTIVERKLLVIGPDRRTGDDDL